jgi:hypothetical protein
MAPKKWRGQEAVLEIGGGSMPTDPIGVLQDVTVTPDREASELRGAGDTRFVDVMETARAFDVAGTVMSWDLETWDRAIEWDDVAAETDPSADIQAFTATVTLNAADGSTKEVGFIDGYFDPPPELSGGREDWIGMDINLRFPDVDSITNTDASA